MKIAVNLVLELRFRCPYCHEADSMSFLRSHGVEDIFEDPELQNGYPWRCSKCKKLYEIKISKASYTIPAHKEKP